MLEIMIAVGIGLWFVVTGLFSYFFVCRNFKDKEDKN